MKKRTRFDFSHLESLPLCRSYATAYFSQVEADVCAGTKSKAVVVVWALGWLTNGQLEIIGVWSARTSPIRRWNQVMTDLDRRGVEEISVGVLNKSLGVLHDGEPEVPDLSWLRSERAFSFSVPDVKCKAFSRPRVSNCLSPALCRMVKDGSLVGHGVHDHISWAVNRHGVFESESAAKLFCASKLRTSHTRWKPTQASSPAPQCQ